MKQKDEMKYQLCDQLNRQLYRQLKQVKKQLWDQIDMRQFADRLSGQLYWEVGEQLLSQLSEKIRNQ